MNIYEFNVDPEWDDSAPITPKSLMLLLELNPKDFKVTVKKPWRAPPYDDYLEATVTPKTERANELIRNALEKNGIDYAVSYKA